MYYFCHNYFLLYCFKWYDICDRRSIYIYIHIYIFYFILIFYFKPNGMSSKLKLNSVALVRTRTIPTERPPPVGEVSANFCG